MLSSKISVVLIERATTHKATKRLESNKKERCVFLKLIVIKNIKKNTLF